VGRGTQGRPISRAHLASSQSVCHVHRPSSPGSGPYGRKLKVPVHYRSRSPDHPRVASGPVPSGRGTSGTRIGCLRDQGCGGAERGVRAVPDSVSGIDGIDCTDRSRAAACAAPERSRHHCAFGQAEFVSRRQTILLWIPRQPGVSPPATQTSPHTPQSGRSNSIGITCDAYVNWWRDRNRILVPLPCKTSVTDVSRHIVGHLSQTEQ